MKRLISRFRKSPSTELLARVFGQHHLATISVATLILVAASCQVQQAISHRSEDSPLNLNTSAANTALAPAAATSTVSALPVYFQEVPGTPKQAKRRYAFELDAPDCNEPNASSVILSSRLKILSPVGTHAVTMHIASTTSGEVITAEVDDQRVVFSPSTPVKDLLFHEACHKLASNDAPPEIELAPRIGETIREWMAFIAPDCDLIAKGRHGWECKLPTVDPDAARQELIGIRTTMIRRWSRQPYLLARRLAVGVSLAQALQSNSVDKDLDTFCHVAKASLPLELPATIASQRWLRGVCGNKNPHRHALALFGLGKTVSEIDFMRQLFERTSKLGSLTIRIPTEASPATQFLVSLKPKADVTDNLAREMARLFTADPAAAQVSLDLPKACWHPVFAETDQLLKLARNLAIAGDAGAVECSATNPPATPQADGVLERYLAESITSETEFILPNGRSKTLRLPTGSYSYTLQPLPENTQDWDDAAQAAPTAQGHIVWDVKRPRPVIAAF